MIASTPLRRVAVLIAATLALCAASAHAAETRQYDAMGRLTDVTYSDGSSFHYTYDANGNIVTILTSPAAAGPADAPLQFALGRTVPDPGSSARHLAFSTPTAGHVALRVFDAAGREVATLVDRDLPAGRHDLQFSTDRWPTGVYFSRLTLGARTRSGRLRVLH